MLDASEYLHLAIHASQGGDHHAALNYLNQALENEPNNAGILYFRAAEHAELGLYERARTGMSNALALEPGIDMARFQLGLLNLQLQHVDDSRAAFATLLDRTPDASLQAFSGAYLDILDGNHAGAAEKLERGLVECSNPALRNDMSRVLASLKDGGEAAKTPVPDADQEDAPVFLGAYRDTQEPH